MRHLISFFYIIITEQSQDKFFFYPFSHPSDETTQVFITY